MDTSALLSPASIEQFLLAFTRVGSMFLPLGLPNTQRAPVSARLVLATLFTFMLWPEWRNQAQLPPEPLWSFGAELALGTLIGLAINAVIEALTLALQMAGLQSGYQYASTVDPSSQADSPVLPVLGQLLAFSLFFAMRGDHLLIRILAKTFRVWPPGWIPAPAFTTDAVAKIGTLILETGIRFALPMVALLVLVDLAMGVVTRAHSQFQLLSIAFPVKMLLALFTFAALLPVWTSLFTQRMSTAETLLKNILPIQ